MANYSTQCVNKHFQHLFWALHHFKNSRPVLRLTIRNGIINSFRIFLIHQYLWLLQNTIMWRQTEKRKQTAQQLHSAEKIKNDTSSERKYSLKCPHTHTHTHTYIVILLLGIWRHSAKGIYITKALEQWSAGTGCILVKIFTINK